MRPAERRLAIGVAVALISAVAGLVAMVGFGPGSPDDPAPVEAPRPRPARPSPLPRATRASLPPPAGVERPEAPEEPPPPAPVTAEDRRAMNYAVDDLVRAARADCLLPYLATLGAEGEQEFVFDAVLYDGQLYDVGLRAMGVDLPPDVLACVADRAWYAEWPEWELAGELRLQRLVSVRP